MHIFTLVALAACDDQDWIPVCAQFPVVYKELEMATAVDQIWYNLKTQRFVLVELKCQRNYDVKDSRGLLPPFAAFNNSARIRHSIQLALTRDMFLRTCPHIGKVSFRIVTHKKRWTATLCACTRIVSMAK